MSDRNTFHGGILKVTVPVKSWELAAIPGWRKYMGPVTDIEERAFRILAEGPITCARLGERLWGKTGRGNCSCPWARPAGALLKRLRERGLVRRAPDKHHTLYELVPR